MLRLRFHDRNRRDAVLLMWGSLQRELKRQRKLAADYPGRLASLGKPITNWNGAAERRFIAENRPTSLIQRLARPQEVADFVSSLPASAPPSLTEPRCG